MRKSFTNKILILLFLFTLFIGAYAHADEEFGSYIPQMQSLPKIVTALNSEDVKVKSWSIYAREDSDNVLNRSEFYTKANTLKQKYNQFNWSEFTRGNQHSLKLSGTYKNKTIQETITLFAYPYKNNFKTYVIYEAKGEEWNKADWKTISLKINERLEGLFPEKNGKIFAWASGSVGGKMDVGMKNKARQILHDLKAEEVEKIENKTFVSLSAYNKHWKDLIQTNGNKMNVQVGLRKVGKQTTVTVGTPIITTEY